MKRVGRSPACDPQELQSYCAAHIAQALIPFPVGERRLVLRHFLLAASAGLQTVLGNREAAEDVYALADQIATQANRIRG